MITLCYKCKKRSARIYSLARNGGKTTETTRYNAVPVSSGDRDGIYMADYNSTQHEDDSVTGVKQMQDHGVQAKS